MKVRALMDCEVIGYRLKKGEEADLPEETAKLLLKFAYVEEVKRKKGDK
ncbi:hypothetical protein [Geobacillus thermoleovorans]|nr:hypothetical protein [Geobacillus thermoleovorans]